MAVTTPATTARIAYHTTVREMPEDERPRERLMRYGPNALQTTELLAIILRVGTRQENVVELRRDCCTSTAGWAGLPAPVPQSFAGCMAWARQRPRSSRRRWSWGAGWVSPVPAGRKSHDLTMSQTCSDCETQLVSSVPFHAVHAGGSETSAGILLS
jgi:hypothetical protein